MSPTGATLIAGILQSIGVDVVFGLVGIPVVDVADQLIQHGIKFISFRNEQSASYAASAYGYLTGKPSVLLVVGGPGVVHACSGIFNSQVNRWPLMVLAGSTSNMETYKGGFQELDQVTYLSPNVKFACRPRNVSQLPELITKAFKVSFSGVPGATYVDLPANFIEDAIEEEDIKHYLATVPKNILTAGAPKFVADPSSIKESALLIKQSNFPLVLVGKGASGPEASRALETFCRVHNIAFLPTPMGKGVIDDQSQLNVSSARSAALKTADVVILVGARLNWILHHGEAPRFSNSARFIQIDISADDIGDNGARESLAYGLVGDSGLTIKALDLALDEYCGPGVPAHLKEIVNKNLKSMKKKQLIDEKAGLLNYHQVYGIIKDVFRPLEHDLFLVIEGANTMDTARISFESHSAKSRLDAGTNATMGVGMGYAIAAKLANPKSIVVAIEGDSAFGFSAMELETISRFELPIIVVVMNNSGVYHGASAEAYNSSHFQLPSTALGKDIRYDVVATALGVKGILCSTSTEIRSGIKEAVSRYHGGQSTLLNILISPGTEKKLEFGWRNSKQTKL